MSSRDWTPPPRTATIADVDSSLQTLEFQRPDRLIKVGFCLGQTVLPENPAVVQQEISPEEWIRAGAFQHENARNAYLLGRRCAKRALGLLEHRHDFKQISILSGLPGNPLIHGLTTPYEVSITHSLHFAVGVVSPALHPVTVDLERIRPERVEAIGRMLTRAEARMVEKAPDPHSTATLLWTAKEALSKWLRSGMSIHFKVLEVKSVRTESDRISGVFAHVFHLRFESWRIGDWWLTLVFPNKSEFRGLDLPPLKELMK